MTALGYYRGAFPFILLGICNCDVLGGAGEGGGGIFNLIYVISVMVDCTPFPVEPCARAGGGEGEQEGPVAV